ncbi:PhoU domain-containing protein [Nanoarchaeota archaeon]
MKRSAIQLANNTIVISLPAKWVRQKGLQKGDAVEVSEYEGKLVLDTEKGATSGRITIDVSNMQPMIKRILGALYKSGYDEVTVRFSTIEELKIIQEVVREEFLGFEVVDQKKDWLIFKNVSHIDCKEYNTMLRRMFRIILSMADDSLEAINKKDKDWLEAIALHDKDVNKIADFCRRVLNTTGAEGQKRIPPAYFIVEQLEKIGDMYRDICKHAEHNHNLSKEILKIYSETNRFMRGFYDIYFDFSLEDLRDFAEERYRLKSVFTQRFGKTPAKEAMMLSLLNNIAESTFDMNGPLMAVNL